MNNLRFNCLVAVVFVQSICLCFLGSRLGNHEGRIRTVDERLLDHLGKSDAMVDKWLGTNLFGVKLTDDEVHWALTNVILPRRGGIWAQPLFRNLSGETLPIMTVTNK